MPRSKTLPPIGMTPEGLARLVFGNDANQILDESVKTSYKKNEPPHGMDPCDGSVFSLLEGENGLD